MSQGIYRATFAMQRRQKCWLGTLCSQMPKKRDVTVSWVVENDVHYI